MKSIYVDSYISWARVEEEVAVGEKPGVDSQRGILADNLHVAKEEA